LSELVQTGVGIPVQRSLALARRIAQVLAYIHDNGIIHRDVKPSNVMVLPNDSVKLLDFGLAHDEDVTRITITGDVLGTLRYMAPEQFAGGACTPSSDVYSLGVVLCQLVAGDTPPREGYNHQPPRQFLTTRPVPESVVRLIESAMAVNPNHRPRDGADL